MTTRQKKRQAPTIRVECDLVLTDPATDEPWLDRRGQWVDYRSKIKYGIIKQLANITEDVTANMVEVDRLLAHVVVDWNWDDDYGEPMPAPRAAGAFDDLESEEVNWLLSNVPGLSEGPKAT